MCVCVCVCACFHFLKKLSLLYYICVIHTEKREIECRTNGRANQLFGTNLASYFQCIDFLCSFAVLT